MPKTVSCKARITSTGPYALVRRDSENPMVWNMVSDHFSMGAAKAAMRDLLKTGVRRSNVHVTLTENLA